MLGIPAPKSELPADFGAALFTPPPPEGRQQVTAPPARADCGRSEHFPGLVPRHSESLPAAGAPSQADPRAHALRRRALSRGPTHLRSAGTGGLSAGPPGPGGPRAGWWRRSPAPSPRWPAPTPGSPTGTAARHTWLRGEAACGDRVLCAPLLRPRSLGGVASRSSRGRARSLARSLGSRLPSALPQLSGDHVIGRSGAAECRAAAGPVPQISPQALVSLA